ncbi:FadR/GntR family transcriptional regulator [Paracoccus saliphilus]|uniref:FadR family transcriptional regulator n=1 Tax=Paracoccus saliphilus TaxID=405559 RepID=A0AA46A6Z9_9RHOB|nr:FadR/GntR family transcriptional regulator [Paracoccus saliphilus]WCR03853.1 FadR family transcriptional regulator [Paracoccus saliphilus]SIT05424.1 transcriptional regulator, GntR family [Paracoccus saliphilus]
MFRPVVQKPRYRIAADQIAEQIRSGALAPGTKVPPDRELVEQLGVSRATVREALIALEIQGYVETRFGAGSYVVEHLPEYVLASDELPEFFDLVEARLHVEGTIASLAAKSCDASTTQRLRELIRKMVAESTPFEEIEAADRDFHLTIAKSTGNLVLVQMMRDIWDMRSKYPEWTRQNNLFGPDNDRSYYEDEHLAIVEPLEAGEPEAAKRAMQIHCLGFAQHGRLMTESSGSRSKERLLSEFEMTQGD